MKTLSLRSKIVIMASAVVAAACLFLTALFLTSADKYMRSMIAYDTAAPNGTSNDTYPDTALDAPRVTSIAENRITYQNTMAALSLRTVLSMLGAILIFAAAIFIVTGRLLKPLSSLTHSICSIDEKNLRHRVDLPQARDEVYSLTQSFNNMMDRLEQAYTVQKHFAANAAHELKTPLSIMKTSLQVLELQDPPAFADYAEFADDVRQSLDRLIKTVEGLMALTDSSFIGDLETVNALDVANQIKNDLLPLAREKGVSLEVTGDDLEFVYHKGMFYRVIYNLVENGIKYNSSGGYVHIAVLSGEQCLLIQDNGSGMDASVIQNIFEPFYRSDLSRSQKIPGSGIGMSIVKTIMDRYGGSLEIDSAFGRGTEIKFKIPDRSAQDIEKRHPPSVKG